MTMTMIIMQITMYQISSVTVKEQQCRPVQSTVEEEVFSGVGDD